MTSNINIGSRAIVEERFVYKEETHFTVLKKSLFFTGDGFTAYDDKGRVVFRVDSYGGDTGELVLMDPNGRCILTVRRKRLSLHHRWEGFRGERTGFEDKPMFSVCRSSMMMTTGRSRMTVETYNNPCTEYYHVDGSFATRKCIVLNGEGVVVAEIRRKVDSHSKVVLGKDAFLLSLKAGFDAAFAMGLVLILDQVHGSTKDNYENSYAVNPIHDSC